MKPKVFDELIKQKFDQGDFEYNPAHWDDLSTRLNDGNKKQRSFIVWFMPLLGMAASITVALAIPTVMRMAQPDNSQTHQLSARTGIQNHQPISTDPGQGDLTQTPLRSHIIKDDADKEETDGFHINLQNALGNNDVKQNKKMINLLAIQNIPDDKKKKKDLLDHPMHTFRHDDVPQKSPGFSIGLLGGINHSSQNNSGYVIGATTRKMISKNMFIEGDLSFLSSSNSTQNQYYDYATTGTTVGHIAGTARIIGGGQTQNASRTTSEQNPQQVVKEPTEPTIETATLNYNLYYAELSPALGWILSKKLSIGAGPDFQQMLIDNRPAPSEADRNNIAVAPLFDIGLMAKTEYAVTKKIKAAVYYREGINNFITPMDKYIDRNYMQFQVKYSLFSK